MLTSGSVLSAIGRLGNQSRGFLHGSARSNPVMRDTSLITFPQSGRTPRVLNINLHAVVDMGKPPSVFHLQNYPK